MQTKVTVTLWLPSWQKLVACLKSPYTKMDTLGDVAIVTVPKDPSRPLGEQIEVKDKEGNSQKKRVDYDPSVNIHKVIDEIHKQIKKAAVETMTISAEGYVQERK